MHWFSTLIVCREKVAIQIHSIDVTAEQWKPLFPFLPWDTGQWHWHLLNDGVSKKSCPLLIHLDLWCHHVQLSHSASSKLWSITHPEISMWSRSFLSSASPLKGYSYNDLGRTDPKANIQWSMQISQAVLGLVWLPDHHMQRHMAWTWKLVIRPLCKPIKCMHHGSVNVLCWLYIPCPSKVCTLSIQSNLFVKFIIF